MEIKKKKRGYLEDYLALGFIESITEKGKPYCLICGKTYANDTMRAGKLREHLVTKHPEDVNLPIKYFENLKLIFELMTPDTSLIEEDTTPKLLTASFLISLLIAKHAKSHTIGELIIKPALKIFVETVLKVDTELIKDLSLSNDTVRSRIDQMSKDIETQLIEILKVTKFSLQLDETTVRRGEALLMAYVRYIQKGVFHEEMLFCLRLKEGTTSSEIFGKLESYFDDKGIPFTNIISCAADGAPSMMGKNTGCLKRIKDKNPSLLILHCVIHRENLVAKNLSLELNHTLSLVIRCINAIKSSAKNERLFQKFCETLQTEHVRLLLHTEVRWLSKGNCLKRFIELFEQIGEFLQDKEEMKILITDDGKAQVSYLADIFHKLKLLNLQLQGSKLTLIDAKTKIFAFVSKLRLYKNEIYNDNFVSFPNLSQIYISDNVKNIIFEHISMIIVDFEARFLDLKNMKFPTWLMHPFEVDINLIEEESVRKEFHELQNNDYMISLFEIRGTLAWISDEIRIKYPISSEIARSLLLPFPSSYLVECGFSAVTGILTKSRNGLDIEERGDLRLKLSTLSPNIQKICENIQFQPSH